MIYAGRAITGLGIGSASLIVRKLAYFQLPCNMKVDCRKLFIFPRLRHPVSVEDSLEYLKC